MDRTSRGSTSDGKKYCPVCNLPHSPQECHIGWYQEAKSKRNQYCHERELDTCKSCFCNPSCVARRNKKRALRGVFIFRPSKTFIFMLLESGCFVREGLKNQVLRVGFVREGLMKGIFRSPFYICNLANRARAATKSAVLRPHS